MAAASPLTRPFPPLRWTPVAGPRRWREALLTLLLVASVPLGVVALRDTLAALAPPAAPVVSGGVDPLIWQPRVVPPEWRWAPEGVEVDRMFRRIR